MPFILVDTIDLVTAALKWLHRDVRGSRDDQPALITTAPPASGDEFEQRRKKYAIMMALRAICVVAAASTYRVSIYLALGFVVAGMILPWCAVLIANDRPAKRRTQQLTYRHDLRPERALPAGDDGRTVDG
jgi:Flp pilus assembly protein TadB